MTEKQIDIRLTKMEKKLNQIFKAIENLSQEDYKPKASTTDGKLSKNQIDELISKTRKSLFKNQNRIPCTKN